MGILALYTIFYITRVVFNVLFTLIVLGVESVPLHANDAHLAFETINTVFNIARVTYTLRINESQSW